MYPLNLDYDPYLVPKTHTHYLAKESRHPLKVVCVLIEAPQQLVQMGYFPCSPVYPTLAVSLDMLELVSTLFILAAPNERAWATTITKYLKNRGHEFATGDALRCRFSSALSQYQVLMQLVDGEMGKIIDDAREKTTAMFRALDDETPVHGQEYANVQMLAGCIQITRDDISHPSTPPPQERPSTNLRNACPLCFGGDLDIVIPGVHLIVCLNANFQLKRNRDKDRRKEFVGLPGSLDPKVVSLRTIFLSEGQIQEWEERTGHKGKAGEMEETEGDLMGGGRPDEIEPGMNLPNATYDACRDSFVAADGDRIKASSTYFDSTGVMALLCHHDHPLVLANLKTAGKKQFYALALISALMELIPNHWRVGVLYNIGCQMHRTLQKWDLMPEYLHRLKFTVSIFHAYGHQWACQLWYHPQKAVMWGLPDGEGCLRVAGHHHCLFILDHQAEHILETKHEGMGRWLCNRVHQADEQLGEALMAVGKCPHGLDVEGLLVQFNEQREFQTKSIDHEKTKALRLEDRALADCLANLKKDKWINLQLNIRVLHDQLITKLRAHKFELANLEHAHASRAMDQKTKSHVEKAVKQCAPGIEATVHKYNAKQKEMLKERGKNGVWRDAYVPPELVMEGLFNLDIDQDIWENADMVDFEGGEIPLWLANKEVRDGIRAAQEVKSCQEELHQCDVEYSNLCAWFVEEYEAVHNVFKFGNGTWECSLATITIPVGAVDWSQISMPPPVNHPWTCRKALQGIPQLGERDEDGDASSDDDDGVELEPVAELEDVGFLGDLDHLIGEGDWSEGEGQDNVMVDL
ncbi:hypothetical protein BS47DRAFT_1360995 [Hydnum rufescens UP504]|uniref:CxC1-like cysteine cluster associated with KDZ transposases domain-containing protein n=1 Tax=Hydnum rufescens UP504 TaxID=1448309 RepID=A0A9P6B333_9AGAM|nr:hypothetical protein BS47DRAFT_1360995 [Hydnum rufescens UP504]